MDFLEPLQTVWDYLGMHQAPEQADVIVGFGNFNTNIARRAAELYRQGLAPVVLFTGGLGRNTEGLLPEPEAVRFARVAMECGVPETAILLEPESTNTAENILFTRRLLEQRGIPHERNRPSGSLPLKSPSPTIWRTRKSRALRKMPPSASSWEIFSAWICTRKRATRRPSISPRKPGRPSTHWSQWVLTSSLRNKSLMEESLCSI